MSLDNLSEPTLQALLAFYVEAARDVEDRLQALSSTAQHTPAVEDAQDVVVQPGTLQPPFNSNNDVHRQSPIAATTPSPPSTPPQAALPPSLRGIQAWPTWTTTDTPSSPTPAPTVLSRKRRRVDDEDDNVAIIGEPEPRRVRVRLDPGWPRGVMRTPPRRKRGWDKENERPCSEL